MMEIDDVRLLELQCRYMQADSTTIALCAAMDAQLHRIARETRKALLLPNVAELPGEVIDALAWQMHTDGYDATATLEERRRMVASSIRVHRYKGTVYAMRQLVHNVYGDDAEVLEWFQYGGEPFHFKVHIYCTDRIIGQKETQRALAIILAGKNARSVLEAFLFVTVVSARMRHRLLLNSVSFALTAENLGIETVRLDGTHRLDGSWLLTSVFTRGLGLERLELAGNLHSHNAVALGWAYWERFCNENSWNPARLVLADAWHHRAQWSSQRVKIALRVEGGSELTAGLTQDTMWKLGEEALLDGSKRLNADIVRSDL